MRIESTTTWAEAELAAEGETIYVEHGALGEAEGTIERIGHFISEREEYPYTESRLREVLTSIVS